MKAKTPSNDRVSDHFEIKQDIGDSRLQVFLKEYELILHHIEGIDTRLLQTIVGILGILGIAIGLFLTQKLELSVGLAWLAPLFFITLEMVLLYYFYIDDVNIWNARIKSRQINAILNEKALICYDPDIPGSMFLSPKRGNLKVRLMYILLYGGTVFLVIMIALYSLATIYKTSHLQGFLFVFVYGLLTSILIFSSLGLFFDVPKAYQDFLSRFSNAEPIPLNLKFSPSIFSISNVSATFSSIIPRIPDLVTKSPFFIFGFVTALVVVGFPPGKLPLINYLFRYTDTDWKSITNIPIWVFFVLGALYFIVEEVLLQQAKLMWDDIRDVERDKILLQNYKRPIVSGRMSVSSAIRQMYVRWILALLLGYLLGGFALLMVFLLISFHQALYILWAKPRAARYPLLVLFIISFNISLRFLAGVVSVIGSQWSLSPFVLLFVLFYFYSFGVMALQWKIEAEYQRDKNQNIAIRPQSEFYLSHGRFWQHVGLVAAVLFAGFILLIHIISLSCGTTLFFLQDWYGQCSSDVGVIQYVNLGLENSIVLIFGFITAFLLITFLFVLLFQKVGNLIAIGIKKIKGVLVAILAAINISLFFTFVIGKDISLLNWNFLVFSILLLIAFEGMTYLEYTFTNLKNRIPWIKGALYSYLFKPIPNLGLKEVLAIMFTEIDPAKLSLMPSVKVLDKQVEEESVIPNELSKKDHPID